MLHLLIVFFSQLPVDSSKAYLDRGMLKEDEGYLSIALQQYTRAKELATNHEVMAGALNGMTSVNITTGRYDSVLAYLERSKTLDTSAFNLMKNLQVEAKYWQTQNQFDLALKALQGALDNATKLDDRKNMAIILSSMGGIYFSHDPDMNNARGFYKRSIALCDSSQHANILARNYGRLANTYMVESDGVNAEKYLKRAKKITDISGNLPLRGYVLSSMSTLLFGQGKYQEALEFMQEPIRIKRELGQLRQLQNDLLNISEAYMMVNDFPKAKKALDEGLQIGKSLKDIVYLKYFYERRSMLDSMQGNYKGAYANLRLAAAYKDSTFSAQRLRDVREIQEKYEAEQKEKTIAEKELEIEHQKYRQALILGASIIAVLMLIVVLVVIRNRSRNKLQREREHQNYLRLQTIVKTQEEVQQRIARDLHDGLVQVLGAAKMSLQSVGPDSDKLLLQKHIRSASDIMDEAVTEARSISHQILPYSLLKDGLIPALEELFARSLASFDFQHDGYELHVNEQTSINIYRIAQELVNNVQKHAESAHVSVSLKAIGSQLKFIFSDNGKGYDTTRSTTGAGLSNMATRAGLLGGTIEVRSVIGKGTTTELTVPL
ncbi:MAG TPA: ATP-binding protein [Cyclobacteriaceae bacterium]|nr:ATP-binding protein [Cyclobacteriaceae bacterium]